MIPQSNRDCLKESYSVHTSGFDKGKQKQLLIGISWTDFLEEPPVYCRFPVP